MEFYQNIFIYSFYLLKLAVFSNNIFCCACKKMSNTFGNFQTNKTRLKNIIFYHARHEKIYYFTRLATSPSTLYSLLSQLLGLTAKKIKFLLCKRKVFIISFCFSFQFLSYYHTTRRQGSEVSS